MWRVYCEKDFFDYIKGFDSNIGDITQFQKMGLFIGAGLSDIYHWWLSVDDVDMKNKAKQYFQFSDQKKEDYTFNVLSNFFKSQETISYGLLQTENKSKNFWMAYYATICGNEGCAK